MTHTAHNLFYFSKNVLQMALTMLPKAFKVIFIIIQEVEIYTFWI